MKALRASIRLGHVALVLVGVVIGLAVGATVLSDSDEAVSSAPQVITDQFALYDTPDNPSFRKVWIRGCVAYGDSAHFCRCAIAEYETQLQPWEFEAAHAVAHSGGQLAELPDHVRELVEDVERKCR